MKLKVAASIVAISSIHLLRVFMNVQGTGNDKILWYVVLHLTFVVSAVLLPRAGPHRFRRPSRFLSLAVAVQLARFV